MFLLNVLSSYGINGKIAQTRLERVGITANKNMIHNDTLTPGLTSGLRIGFAAATTRGCGKEDAIEIARLINSILKEKDEDFDVAPYKRKVKEIVSRWKNVMDLEF